jgi:hypothetical protein
MKQLSEHTMQHQQHHQQQGLILFIHENYATEARADATREFSIYRLNCWRSERIQAMYFYRPSLALSHSIKSYTNSGGGRVEFKKSASFRVSPAAQKGKWARARE